MMTNKFGLSRNIPARTKKEIRKACGYGCIICGSSIYQYEHIEPLFNQATEHDPETIGLLCGACHDNVTRKIWSKERVKEARANPRCKQIGYSSFAFDVSKNENFFIQIGNTRFMNLESIIEIEDMQILQLNRPEEPYNPPRINAQFFDRNGTNIASITDNEWAGSVSAFDIETTGNRISIRSAKRKIDLSLILEAPRLLKIDSLNLFYKDTSISGSSRDGFTVSSGITSILIPAESRVIQRAPFWISVKGQKLHLGTDEVMTFKDAIGQVSQVPGHLKADGVKLEWADPEGGELPPGAKPGEIMKITATKDHGSLTFAPNSTQVQREPGTPRIGRNAPCPCGSGKKYKKCHGLNA